MACVAMEHWKLERVAFTGIKNRVFKIDVDVVIECLGLCCGGAIW